MSDIFDHGDDAAYDFFFGQTNDEEGTGLMAAIMDIADEAEQRKKDEVWNDLLDFD